MTDRDVWLITGATGLLGANAAVLLSKTKKIIGLARRTPSLPDVDFLNLDLTDSHARKDLLDRLKPNVVLNCAALASLEGCETHPQLAQTLNVDAAADLAGQAAQMQIPFIQISTDAVYDGNLGNYREDDETSPTTVYGQSKRDAELAVLEQHPDALVARVNFYGFSPSGSRSLAEYFMRNLSAGKPAPGFTDVKVSTMYVKTLIDRLERLVAMQASGVFNVVNDEPISKFEFGRAIARRFGFAEALVTSALSTDVLSVVRGSDLSLDTAKLNCTLGLGSSQKSDIDALFDDWVLGKAATISAFASHSK